MLDARTAAQLDHGLAALRLAQELGGEDGERVPEPGACSLADLAAYCGLSPDTIQRVERIALAKVARGLRAKGLPAHLAARLCPLIDDARQPELF